MDRRLFHRALRLRSRTRDRGRTKLLARLLPCLAAATLVCACGGGSSGGAGLTPSGAASSTGPAAAGSWERVGIGQAIPATMPFQALSFADAQNGMSVTYAAYFTTFVAATPDDGATWSVNQLPRPQGAQAFNAISSPEPGLA